MPSPFPGMDPFLETDRHWPAFQHELVDCLVQLLGPQLADRYQARPGSRRYVPRQVLPDAAGGECVEEFVEVRNGADGRLVTLIDVVSPTNKTSPAGRAAYLATRREAAAGRASVVEIDLVLQGRPALDYPREGLPEWDYAVTVTRAAQPAQHEVYTATLQKGLPRFPVPLASGDRDAVLSLQAAFARAYDRGGFADRIDYRGELAMPEGEGARLRLRRLRRDVGLQSEGEPPPRADASGSASGAADDEVAVAAYHLWEREGRPQGRDEEFWYRAVEQLRR